VSTNPFEPPKEVGVGSASWILWLVIGSAAVTLVAWPCFTLALMAGLPWGPIEEPDHGIAVHAELYGRLVVSAAISLPLAVIVGLAAMLVGNHRRRRTSPSE
jgi:hypothetical protein